MLAVVQDQWTKNAMWCVNAYSDKRYAGRIDNSIKIAPLLLDSSNADVDLILVASHCAMLTSHSIVFPLCRINIAYRMHIAYRYHGASYDSTAVIYLFCTVICLAAWIWYSILSVFVCPIFIKNWTCQMLRLINSNLASAQIFEIWTNIFFLKIKSKLNLHVSNFRIIVIKNLTIRLCFCAKLICWIGRYRNSAKFPVINDIAHILFLFTESR